MHPKIPSAVGESIQRNLDLDDAEWQTVIESLWNCVAESEKCLVDVLACKDPSELDNAHFAIRLILVATLSDMVSATLLLQQGFFHSAPVVMRSAVEQLALVVSLKSDASTYEKYEKEKFKTSEAITKAKKHFNWFGNVYGILTNHYVHPPLTTFGRAFENDEGTIRYVMVPSLRKISLSFGFVSSTQLGQIILGLGEISEWCFLDWIKNPSHWHKSLHSEPRPQPSPATNSLLTIFESLKRDVAEKTPGPAMGPNKFP